MEIFFSECLGAIVIQIINKGQITSFCQDNYRNTLVFSISRQFSDQFKFFANEACDVIRFLLG